MKKAGQSEMLTPRQYAQKHDVAYTTVMKWLQNGLIQGAKKAPLPYEGYIYQIPKDAPPPDLKPGPKPAKKGKAK
jgi:hypothetical protein